MRTISQREMRNSSGEILRQVAAGESFEVTNGRVPVARLVPIASDEPGLPVARPATRNGGFSLPTRVLSVPTEQILDDLRAER